MEMEKWKWKNGNGKMGASSINVYTSLIIYIFRLYKSIQ